MKTPQTPDRFAMALAQLTLLGAIALPASAAAIWLFWRQLAPFAAENLQYAFDVRNLGVGGRLAGFSLSLLAAAIQAFGLLGVRQTFLEAAHGRAFSSLAVSGFRRFAWVSLIMVLVGIFQRTLLIVIFSLNDPNKGGTLSIQLGSSELSAFFLALLLVFVAKMFTEGKLVKDENDSFL